MNSPPKIACRATSPDSVGGPCWSLSLAATSTNRWPKCHTKCNINLEKGLNSIQPGARRAARVRAGIPSPLPGRKIRSPPVDTGPVRTKNRLPLAHRCAMGMSRF
jgi:hypothetical protein